MNKAPWLKYLEGQNDPSTLWAYRSLIEKVKVKANEILNEYSVEFVDVDPYKTSIEMRRDLINKKIKVFNWWGIHPAFSRDENNLLRLVHDVEGHWLDLSFSLSDEIKTYDRMVNWLSLEVDEARALYSEIVWQVTAYYITWNYQEQKILFIN